MQDSKAFDICCSFNKKAIGSIVKHWGWNGSIDKIRMFNFFVNSGLSISLAMGCIVYKEYKCSTKLK